MITLHFHLQPQYKYGLFHINFTYTIALGAANENEQTRALFVCMLIETNTMLCCSQVTAGDGHSWKGSVVSDTVKRECSSVPVVSVQRQSAHSQPSNGKRQTFLSMSQLVFKT